MQISGSGTTPTIQLRLPQKAIQGLALKDGTILVATVQKSEPSGQLTLEISGKLLQAVSSLRLAAGITLRLRVENKIDGTTLHLDEPESQHLLYQQALRQNLPRQQSLQSLLQRLAQWSATETNSPQRAPDAVATTASAERPAHSADNTQAPDITAASLPKPIARAIARLLTVIPALEQLVRPADLQRAITGSGFFLENHLLHGTRPTELDSDVKTVLLRLARTIRQHQTNAKVTTTSASREALRETLQGLLRQIEGAIARIQSNQLNALGNRGEGEERLNITLELPFFDAQQREIDTLQIRIRRNGGKHDNRPNTGWSIVLHLTPEDYGSIHAVVTLSEGKISTTFWCEEEDTARLFREQLHRLEERFTEQGLETAQCSSRCGKPPRELTQAGDHPEGLIDAQA